MFFIFLFASLNNYSYHKKSLNSPTHTLLKNNMAGHTKKIQAIFDETITKIIRVVDIQPSTTSQPTTDTVSIPGIDKVKLSTDLIPILQTFLMNVQIYHTATFNGIVNGISTFMPEQSLITGGEISQPSVSTKWETPLSTTNYSDSNISILENQLAGFAAMELNDTRPINLLQAENSAYLPRSAASQETRRFWEQPRTNQRQTFNSTPPSYVLSNQSNYDDFLKHYTDEFTKYHNTYVDDSSEGENEDAYQSLSEYVSERTSTDLCVATIEQKPEQPSNLVASAKTGFETGQCDGTQCCARLSKYMKYRIADLQDDFIKSYPPDTYIEGGFVFGKPCLNIISSETEDKGGFFCQEHLNDTGVEDIRQPRQDITYDRDHRKDDDLEIVFNNEGYSATPASSYKMPSTTDCEGFDYYGEYDPNYSASRQINPRGVNDAFSKNHQCCARLNKFRLYRLELEPTNFLDTYPDDVHIEDGCIYGTACQNLISDESYGAGIRFCIEHESDPYVDNICEPMVINSKLKTLGQQTTQNHTKKSNTDLAEMGTNTNESSVRTVRRSARLNQSGSYEWDKYNTDFNYLC